MTNVTTKDIITEEAVRRQVLESVEESLQFRRAFDTLDVSGISNDTIKLPKDDDTMTEPVEVGEGAEFPRDEEDVSTISATVKKYGMEVKITNEAIEDSLFDVMSRQVDKAGRKMNEKLNNLAFTELDANLHTNSPVGNNDGTLAWDEVVDAKKELRDDGYNPTILIVDAEGEADLLKSSEFQRATDLGDETILEGQIGRVAGLDVFLDNDGLAAANDAYVIDPSRYGFDVVKEDISTQSYDDPARQAEVFQVWTRRVFKAQDSNAAIKVQG